LRHALGSPAGVNAS